MREKALHMRRFVRWIELATTRRRLAVLMTGAILLGLVAVFRMTTTSATGSKGSAKQPEIQRARMSDEISVHAAGRGNPWINLSDGYELITPYSGPAELTQILERNEARSLSLCSADFDEDGVPDLISGYAGPSGGIVALLRGNVDSIYPNAPEAKQRKAEGAFTNAPFLSPAFLFSVPEAADFIGAGDFDGDGHWDVVGAARGSDNLYLLSGDGKGSLRETKRIDLQGGVTAMVVGEINRRDGLDDIVVGVSGERGAKVLIFEGPEGALRANPEIFDLPAEATSLALGQLDDSYEMDLAIAAGHVLIIVHGRDRKLSLDAQRQAEVQRAAAISRRPFSFTIRSLAVGGFSGNHATEIALLSEDGSVHVLSEQRSEDENKKANVSLTRWKDEVLLHRFRSEASQLISARVSSLAIDNLVVANADNNQIELIAVSIEAGRKATVGQVAPKCYNGVSALLDARCGPLLPMKLNGDALSDLVVLRLGKASVAVAMTQPEAVLNVINTNDSGPGSLRQAILDANARPGADNISFNIPSSGTPTITPLSTLPTITEAVSIDATTQPVGKVELDGTSAGSNLVGLDITGGNSRVRGFVINRFVGSEGSSAIALRTNGGNVIEGNYIGTNINATTALANTGNGVYIPSSSNNTIGGTTAEARNVISGNRFPGIFIGNSDATGNQVLGNLIGTNATGTSALGNSNDGIAIDGVLNNTIGGVMIGARNTISSNNGSGILIINKARGNLTQGNLIGTDVSGTADLGNIFVGVFIVSGSTSNNIGGTIERARNIISGNVDTGVVIGERESGRSASGNLVQGNFIGTDITGRRRLGNKINGVWIISGSNNTIGGDTPGARNVISGNKSPGVGLGGLGGADVTRNQVQGNLIGTNATGNEPLGNDGGGLLLGGFFGSNGAPNIATSNTIGGTTATTRNIISGNNGNGLMIINTASVDNLVQGNFVGTDPTGTIAVRNTGSGVFVTRALANTIGGTTPGSGNLISGNLEHGIGIGIPKDGLTGGTGVRVQGNLIGTDISGKADLGNGLNGIFVDADSVTNTIEGNLIAFNKRNGICIPDNSNPGVRIQMTSNLIYSNATLGIDLGPPGVTPNDDKDPDTGANEQQNFPVLSLINTLLVSPPTNPIMSALANTSVTGTFNSTPNSNFTLQFFFGSNCQGTGRQFTGLIPVPLDPTIQVRTDNNGNAGFTYTFQIPSGFGGSGFVNATATNSTGNTSEFSECIAVTNTNTAPIITSACKGEGKLLFVFGSGFVDGAKVFINEDVEKKTQFVSSTQVIAFKAGKRTFTGDKLKVRNPDSTETPEVSYTRADCPP